MIPDPIERMESRIDDMAFEFEAAHKDLPAGSYRCPNCKRVFNYDPISVSPDPDADYSCYECLSPELRMAYDEYYGKES